MARLGRGGGLPPRLLPGVYRPRLRSGRAAVHDPQRSSRGFYICAVQTLGRLLDYSSASASSVGGAPTLCPTFCSMCTHLFARLDRRNCRNCGDADELFCRSLIVTDPQRRNGHACTSVGYFLVHDNGRRGLLWGRVTSDTGRASKASRLAAHTGLRTFAVIGHCPARFPPRGRSSRKRKASSSKTPPAGAAFLHALMLACMSPFMAHSCRAPSAAVVAAFGNKADITI
jgi:hypothetical protein